MLSSAQWEDWLDDAARRAYAKSGHLLHPSELEMAMLDPSGYITEHSGIDPLSLDHLNSEEAGHELAKGMLRQSKEEAAIMDTPEMRAHIEAWRNGLYD